MTCLFQKPGKKSNLHQLHNKSTRVVYALFVLNAFCHFLQLHYQNCPKMINFESLLHAHFFLARDQSRQSQAGNMGPSCPLGVHYLLHSPQRCFQLYNNESFGIMGLPIDASDAIVITKKWMTSLHNRTIPV